MYEPNNDVINISASHRKELAKWRRVSVLLAIALMISGAWLGAGYLKGKWFVTQHVAALQSDVQAISQWYQRYQFIYDSPDAPMIFSLADLVSVVNEHMQDDGMSQQDILVLAEYWQSRRYYLLGQDNHALIAPVSQAVCQALVDTPGDASTLINAIMNAYKLEQNEPWCYSLKEAEIRQFTPSFLWRGETAEARHMMIMLMPKEVAPSLESHDPSHI